MVKTYKVEVDCANCANLVEHAIRKVEGVKNANLSFMTGKLKVEFEEGSNADEVMTAAIQAAKKVESDVEIYQ